MIARKKNKNENIDSRSRKDGLVFHRPLEFRPRGRGARTRSEADAFHLQRRPDAGRGRGQGFCAGAGYQLRNAEPYARRLQRRHPVSA